LNLRDKNFWLPILIAIPIGIFINLVTDLLDLQVSFAILIVSGLVISYFLVSDKITNWRAERSRQSREKAINELRQELAEVDLLRGDLSKLVSRIAWDMLVLQAAIVIIALLAITVLLVFPTIIQKPSSIFGASAGLIIGLVNQLKELRYIRRVYNFDEYREKVEAKLENLNALDWVELLISRKWILVHGPPDGKKAITFLRNGKVHEGQNQNEHSWNKKDGKLELVQEDGRVHSRFTFDKKTARFNHTNEPDTLSNRNQFIYLHTEDANRSQR
jgi:hypothetical protein